MQLWLEGLQTQRNLDRLVLTHFRDRLETGEYSTARHLASAQARTIKEPCIHGRYLELGCGTQVSCDTSGNDVEVYAIDIQARTVREFRRHHPDAEEVIVCDARSLPFRDSVFNNVASTDVLHHLVGSRPLISRNNVEAVLRETRRIMDSGGMLWINEQIARNRLFRHVMFYVTLLCAQLRVEVNFFDIHSRVVAYFMTEEELTILLCYNGFTLSEKEVREWDTWAERKKGLRSYSCTAICTTTRLPVGQYTIRVDGSPAETVDESNVDKASPYPAMAQAR